MNNLITIAGDKLQLPAAANEGAKRLFGKLERLPQWLPGEVEAARFIMAVTAEANRVPRDVEPSSIVAAAFNCAVVGLLPGPQLGHAHFVPFKQKGGPRRCQLIIGYKGYLELAYGVGFLKDVQPEVVLQGEEFNWWNDASGAQVMHKLLLDRELVWSNVRAAYCIWHSITGGHGIAVVGRNELETLKRRGNVWNDNPIAMSKKTAILRARKLWKVTGRMADATYLDDLAERGEPQPLLRGDEPEDEPTPALTEFDAEPQAEPDNESPADQYAKARGDFLAALADASGLRQCQTIYEARLPLLPKGSEKWATEQRDRRLEEIRATRGPRSNKPKPDAGDGNGVAAKFRQRIKAASGEAIELGKIKRELPKAHITEAELEELLGLIGG